MCAVWLSWFLLLLTTSASTCPQHCCNHMKAFFGPSIFKFKSIPNHLIRHELYVKAADGMPDGRPNMLSDSISMHEQLLEEERGDRLENSSNYPYHELHSQCYHQSSLQWGNYLPIRAFSNSFGLAMVRSGTIKYTF